MTARLTAGQHHEIATRHEAGESLTSLARAFGCSASNINMVCLNLGAVSPKAHPSAVIALGPARIERDGRIVRRFMPDEDARITGMEAAGLGDRAIGLALGRDKGSIRMRRKTLARHASRMEVG